MGLEDRHSNLEGKPKDIANKSVITPDSPLAFKPLDVKSTPSITDNSVLAYKPTDTKTKPISTSVLSAKPLDPTDKLGEGILNKHSIFDAEPVKKYI